MRQLAVKRLRTDAVLPRRVHADDAGFDLTACEPCTIGPGDRATVGTGIAIAFPVGCAGLVVPRSGLAARHGISVVNAPGLIDAGYRGEIKVILLNTDRAESFDVAPGDRIAQLVVVPIAELEVTEVAELDDTARGDGGLGSSGR